MLILSSLLCRVCRTKKQLLKLRSQATKNVEAKLAPLSAPLAKLGFPLKL